MRILFLNPNTSETFTATVQSVVDQYKDPHTVAVAMNPGSGPRSIESIYDEVLSSAGTLERLISELNHYDAFVIACYSDHPVIYAAREITDKPVLGIAEASMYLACMLGYKFSVVTTNEAWEPLLWDAVRRYGLAERCASVRSTGMPVLALVSVSPEETYRAILNSARQAIETDKAEVICLGCAGMAGLDKRLEAELNVPVIDGVVSALKLLEGLVGYGVHTSKRRAYARPKWKELLNIPRIFEQPYDNSSTNGE